MARADRSSYEFIELEDPEIVHHNVRIINSEIDKEQKKVFDILDMSKEKGVYFHHIQKLTNALFNDFKKLNKLMLKKKFWHVIGKEEGEPFDVIEPEGELRSWKQVGSKDALTELQQKLSDLRRKLE